MGSISGTITTVYVVTSGEYSDYRIDAIFSTREKAQAYIAAVTEGDTDRYPRFNDIEEWDVDDGDAVTAKLRQGLRVWTAHLNADGETWRVSPDEPSADLTAATIKVNRARRSARDWLAWVQCWARDKEHAVKIAADLWYQAQAEGRR